jgi:hypothetical protein
MAATKFGIGAVSDIAAQQTVNGVGSKINWWEVGLSGATSMFGMNAYTGSALSNLVQVDSKDNYVFPIQNEYSVSNFTVNALLGGVSGSISNILFPNIGPSAGIGLANNAAQTGGATILSYWGGTASGLGAQAASDAQIDDSSKKN